MQTLIVNYRNEIRAANLCQGQRITFQCRADRLNNLFRHDSNAFHVAEMIGNGSMQRGRAFLFISYIFLFQVCGVCMRVQSKCLMQLTSVGVFAISFALLDVETVIDLCLNTDCIDASVQIQRIPVHSAFFDLWLQCLLLLLSFNR